MQSLILMKILLPEDISVNVKAFYKQECIPVGCIPSAAMAVCLGEGVCLEKMSAQEGGVCLGVST